MKLPVARYHIYYLRNCKKDARGVHIVAGPAGIRELEQDLDSAGRLRGKALLRQLPADAPRGGLLNVAPEAYRIFQSIQISVNNDETLPITLREDGSGLTLVLSPDGYARVLEAVQIFAMKDDFSIGATANGLLANHIDADASIWFWHQLQS